MRRLEPGRITRGLGYLGVVGLAACVDLGGFLVLTRLGAWVPAAAIASFLAAALLNYTLSALLVFKAPLSPRGLQTFLAVGFGGLLINATVTSLVHALGLPPLPSKAAGIGVAFFFNLAGNVLVVFRPARTQGQGDDAGGANSKP